MAQNVTDILYNVTGNITELTTLGMAKGESDQIMQKRGLAVLFIGLYIIIFILGLSGNTLVVYVVVRNRTMQTITNIFITNSLFLIFLYVYSLFLSHRSDIF